VCCYYYYFYYYYFYYDDDRYRVFTGTDRALIISKVRYEMLHLLTTPEEEVSTTLLMLPFAFPTFQEFYAFQLELDDVFIPDIEREGRGPLKTDPEEPAIKLAAFHPLFQWAGTNVTDALNFEKRAPFPTLNLLRASRVREAATAATTSTIADGNAESLEDVGGPRLQREFADIVKMALAMDESESEV
jgi:hypothetical protein